MSVGTYLNRRTLVLVALAAGTIAAAVAVLLAQRAAPSTAGAADHLDAPGLTPPGGDARLDITDIYAFRAPDNAKSSVLIMNVNGLSKAGTQASFATDIPSVAKTRRASYVFYVDNNGDARPDITIRTTFGKPDANGRQTLTVTRNGKAIATGTTATFGKASATRAGGVRVYAGMRDDPFFFDLQGFLNILSKTPGKSFLGCTGTRPDAFAGTNISSLAIELPSSMLTRDGKTAIGVWGVTMRGATQIDRMGRPAIATVFIPKNPFNEKQPYMKNQFNKTQPKDDRARWKPEVVNTLKLLYSLNDASGDDSSDDASKVDGLANVLLPDILTYDTANPAGFLNGRKPADDVIDAELNLITEGAATTDCVGKNDVPFPKGFPYLAAPH